jgi:hypothetical protein
MQNALTLEALKEHQKTLDKMKNDKPKLFGLIMQHLSAESKDEAAGSWTLEIRQQLQCSKNKIC